jgi:hypothetical protein
MKKQKLLRLASAVTLAFAASTSHATLVFDSQEHIKGAGLGNVNTILTIHQTGNPNDPDPLHEEGSVFVNGLNAQQESGETQSITQLQTLSNIGATSAANLRIVFNAAEPSGDGISLDNLVLNIWDPNGSLLFTTGDLPAPVAFLSTDPGVGNAGFSFKLDPVQAALAQTQAFAGSFANNRIGLAARVSGFDGGPETFFATSVPEPGTWALFAAGLIGVAGLARRRVSL